MTMPPHQQTWWPLRHPGLDVSESAPLDSKPEFSRLLGLIFERWTLMEAELARSLACLLDGNEAGARAILRSLNATSDRIKMVRALAQDVIRRRNLTPIGANLTP